jgi:hypothetical protein
MTRKRAAYFQLRPDTFGRPFDDGIARALDAAGYDLDVYAPPQIAFRRSWLTGELFRPKWRRYDLFLGNPDLGTAFAAALARAAFRPFVNAVEEVYVGGYEGEARSYWKRIARAAARQARFTIITDLCRAELQREYAGLPRTHRFVPYPSCYPDPYAGPTRGEARAMLGLDAAELIVSVTGALTESNGVHWLFGALDAFDGCLLIQPGNRPDAVLESLVRRLERERRAVYLPERLGWREAAERTMAADVSAVFYLSPKPQFQRMGVSSQKLGMSLWLGIPVIATRQPSFEFIREFGCGELIGGPEELPAAIERIRGDHARYAAGARRAVDEYIRPGEKLAALTEAFEQLRPHAVRERGDASRS